MRETVLTVCLLQASRETVETVFESSQLWVTGLKPGVNEMGRFSDFLRQGRVALFLIRWSARLLSISSTVLLLMFLFGEKFEVSKVTASQWLGIVFFPLGIIVGFVVAWWKEGLGGAITIASLLVFYLVFVLLLKGSLSQGVWFLVFAVPGFLFLISSAISRSLRNGPREVSAYRDGA